ncbi:MAG: hypothetical protein EXX96DRAFT_594757 [Benjaminiella poitrasii]|nr:MAG: hypothetical protein EXX96DRAFT_594757 [Benjaminiella poitrasii]
MHVEIISSMIKLANDQKEVPWTELTTDLKNLIISQYNGKSISKFKELLKEHQSFSFSSSNITKSSYSLSEEEKKRVLARYDAIEEENKWHLKTGTLVEDKTKALTECSSFEHLVHSLIVDPDDIVWIRYFTADELNEIKSNGVKSLEKLPQELQKYLDSYDKEWITGNELCKYTENQKYIPLIEFDKRWIHQSMIGISELFCDDNQLHLEDYSESDLLHELLPFVYRTFRDHRIRGKLGERSIIAVGLARNANRSLERQRKAVGAKLPTTLRDMLCMLVNQNPHQTNNLSTIGLLIIGLNMEFLRMDIPQGSAITRILRKPMFEITCKAKQAMLKNLGILALMPAFFFQWLYTEETEYQSKEAEATINTLYRLENLLDISISSEEE